MRYLVTGGAGMLGSLVCRRLLDEGDEVVAYDLGLGRDLVRALGEEVARKVLVRGDVTDGMHLLRIARETRADSIIHLASLLSAESAAAPGAAVRINCGGMVNALETARILGLPRVVWASSASVHAGYHDPNQRTANDAPYAPNGIYAGTKILNEMVAAEYARSYGVDTIGIRFTLMVGAGKQGGLSGHISSELIEKPVRGLPGRLRYGDDIASWLWAGDSARALVLAARVKSHRATAYNISGELCPLREAAEIVRGLIPGADISLEPGTWGLLHVVDTSAIEEDLGFRIEWKLEDQLRELIAQVRAEVAARR